ncbi:M23 family metallopeptidase [Polycladidibacter hongkongensis]|uniref:M23 family metallopeptidase n=1 Tax=Polycladidibacter hongkongensis TaxID=1647556 RepID=UPI0009E88B41|nr:M23 family metallopeptidase [Pseudovibrio hongkongensis]
MKTFCIEQKLISPRLLGVLLAASALAGCSTSRFEYSSQTQLTPQQSAEMAALLPQGNVGAVRAQPYSGRTPVAMAEGTRDVSRVNPGGRPQPVQLSGRTSLQPMPSRSKPAPYVVAATPPQQRGYSTSGQRGAISPQPVLLPASSGQQKPVQLAKLPVQQRPQSVRPAPYTSNRVVKNPQKLPAMQVNAAPVAQKGDFNPAATRLQQVQSKKAIPSSVSVAALTFPQKMTILPRDNPARLASAAATVALPQSQKTSAPTAVTPAAPAPQPVSASAQPVQAKTMQPVQEAPAKQTQSPSTPADTQVNGQTLPDATAQNEVVTTNSVPAAQQQVAAKAPPAVKGAGMPAFRWPVRGRIISDFGTKASGARNDGINLAVPEGTEVRSVLDGTVVYAGNELKGFGNLVLIRHADGWVSAYAHNKKLQVQRGDVVRRGQVLSLAGASGSVSQPQLHFELRRDNAPVDPLVYLPTS